MLLYLIHNVEAYFDVRCLLSSVFNLPLLLGVIHTTEFGFGTRNLHKFLDRVSCFLAQIFSASRNFHRQSMCIYLKNNPANFMPISDLKRRSLLKSVALSPQQQQEDE